MKNMLKVTAIGIVCALSLVSLVNAATYTSTQAGNWNTDATWGGGGHPNLADDIAVIGHAVTYDVGESSIDWGNVTINNGGSLIFPTGASSKMEFNATAILTVNSGGTLQAGTSGTPIGAAYTCKLHWPQGSSARYVFVINDGAIVNIYGDPTYYGSTRNASLDSDWTTGQTFYVTGDLTSKWASGQKFYIHENINYDNYQNDGHIYTIASVGSYDSGNDRTPITISESAPAITFTAVHATTAWQNKLIMLSRNIELADPGTTLTVYYYNTYTERIRLDNNQATGNNLIRLKDVFMYGWDYGIDGGYNFNCQNVVLGFNNYGSNSGTANMFSLCDFISNSIGSNYGTAYTFSSCDFISNNYGSSSGTAYTFSSCDFISNNYGSYSGTANIFSSCDFISNNRGSNSGIAYTFSSCDFISNNYGSNYGTAYTFSSCDFVSNDYGSYYGTAYTFSSCDFISNNYGSYSGTAHIFSSCDFVSNTSNIGGMSASNDIRSNIFENTDFSGILRALRVYTNSGNFLPLVSGETHWQTPDSGNNWILEATPNSYISTGYPNYLVMSPHKQMAVYCPSGAVTLTFKIYPSGWTIDLDESDIYLKAAYLSDAGNETADVQTTTATFSDDGWRNLTVSFTNSRAGVVYFNLYLTRYESGAYVLIDPVWTLS